MLLAAESGAAWVSPRPPHARPAPLLALPTRPGPAAPAPCAPRAPRVLLFADNKGFERCGVRLSSGGALLPRSVPRGATRSGPSLCRGGGAGAPGAPWHGLAGGRSRAGLSLSAARAHRTTRLESRAFFLVFLAKEACPVACSPPCCCPTVAVCRGKWDTTFSTLLPHKQSSSLAQLSTCDCRGSPCLPNSRCPKHYVCGRKRVLVPPQMSCSLVALLQVCSWLA